MGYRPKSQAQAFQEAFPAADSKQLNTTYLLKLGQCVIVLLNLTLLVPVVDLQQVIS